MDYRKLNGNTSLLRIYLSDFDKYQHHDLYRLIVKKARASGLAGCTVFRGFWGYGVRGFVHTDIALEGAGERPILVEIIDSKERVQSFVQLVIPMLTKAGGLMTEETVYVHQYQYSPLDPKRDHEDQSEKLPSYTKEATMKRELSGQQTLLRVFIDELDKFDHKPLFAAILDRCQKLGIAGCTVIQGIMGFGASSVIHKGHLFRLSQDLPVLLEIVDTDEKIHTLLEQIKPMLQGALVTEEKVTVHHYSSNQETQKAS